MINAQTIIDQCQALDYLIGQVEAKDLERWTLGEDEAIKDALASLSARANMLYAECMTEEELAKWEREGRDDEY